MVEIITLVENRAAAPGFSAEHGLSLLLLIDGKKWLFDVGQTGVVLDNARGLGLDLKEIEGVILSHGHYDHTGGLLEVCRVTGGKAIYAHPGVFRERWNVRKGNKPRSVGFPFKKKKIEKAGGRFVFNRETAEIGPGLYLSGAIPRVSDFERGDPFLVVEEGEGFQLDPFLDDQFLAVRTPKGIVMVNGCCHSGLINSLELIAVRWPEEKVRAIIGGLHLYTAPPKVLGRVMELLEGFDPETIIAGHCTGEAAETELARRFGARFCPLKAGLKFRFY